MARPNPVRRIMESSLPGITYQRRKSFRPGDEDINYAFNILNRYIFDNTLVRPEIRKGTLRRAWGICTWSQVEHDSGSWCDIKLMDKWFCAQWFLNTLAHEMIHQYQWDVYRWEHLDYYGRPMYENSGAHGPTFYEWRDRFEHYGLTLKMSFSQRRWFKYQDFTKS